MDEKNQKEIMDLIKGALAEARKQDSETKESETKVSEIDNSEDYICGECGARFRHKAKYCPNCGIEFEEY